MPKTLKWMIAMAMPVIAFLSVSWKNDKQLDTGELLDALYMAAAGVVGMGINKVGDSVVKASKLPPNQE